jgi:hypothetical protein
MKDAQRTLLRPSLSYSIMMPNRFIAAFRPKISTRLGRSHMPTSIPISTIISD